MSSQGFVGGLMQGYDFMDDRYNRKAQNERLARQESRADKRLGMQEEAHEIEKMQRERADEARKIQAVQYKIRYQVPLSEDEQKIVDRYAGDERTQRFMQKVEKDPRKVYSAADSILRGVKGEASKEDVINASNYLFDSWIGQGDGKNKRIADLKPIDGKIYAELEYDDEETGERVTGAPLTYRRRKSDSVVRDLEVGRAAEAAQMMKALAAERIRLGDTGPLEQQAAADKQKAELGLKAWERQNEVEDRNFEHLSKVELAERKAARDKEIARIKNQAEQSGLGKIPGYIEQALTTPVVDEEGNLIRDIDGNPQYQTDQEALAGLCQFALANNINNWDDAYRAYSQAARQQQEQMQQQKQQEQIQQQINERAGKVSQLVESGDIERAQKYMQNYREQAPDVYRIIINTLPGEVRKALEQEVRPEPKKEYTLKKGINDATTKARGVADKAVQTGRGLSQWMDDINIKWK
jgi:hypothetical protein